MRAPSPRWSSHHPPELRSTSPWPLGLRRCRLAVAATLLLLLGGTIGCYEAPLPENPDVVWLRESPPPVPEGEFCVVSDEPSKKGFTVEYKGKKIYLCCKKCVRSFAAEPERYVGTGG